MSSITVLVHCLAFTGCGMMTGAGIAILATHNDSNHGYGASLLAAGFIGTALNSIAFAFG